MGFAVGLEDPQGSVGGVLQMPSRDKNPPITEFAPIWIVHHSTATVVAGQQGDLRPILTGIGDHPPALPREWTLHRLPFAFLAEEE